MRYLIMFLIVFSQSFMSAREDKDNQISLSCISYGGLLLPQILYDQTTDLFNTRKDFIKCYKHNFCSFRAAFPKRVSLCGESKQICPIGISFITSILLFKSIIFESKYSAHLFPIYLLIGLQFCYLIENFNDEEKNSKSFNKGIQDFYNYEEQWIINDEDIMKLSQEDFDRLVHNTNFFLQEAYNLGAIKPKMLQCSFILEQHTLQF